MEREGAIGAMDGKKNAYATACNSGAAVQKRRGEETEQDQNLEGGSAAAQPLYPPVVHTGSGPQRRGRRCAATPPWGRGAGAGCWLTYRCGRDETSVKTLLRFNKRVYL